MAAVRKARGREPAEAPAIAVRRTGRNSRSGAAADKDKDKAAVKDRVVGDAGVSDKRAGVTKTVINDINTLKYEVTSMPGFDGSGPQGMGPMTGGARGYCNPGAPGYPAGYGMARGMAYGRGRRFRRGFGGGGYPPAYAGSEASELSALKAQATAVKNTLDEINRRISELENV